VERIVSAVATKQYVDLDVAIESSPAGFVVRVESAGGGQAEADFHPPFTQDELELFVLRLTRPRRATRRIETPQMEAVKRFGEGLFDALFTGELRACLRASHEDAIRQGKGLRIRIHPVSAPELADVPWEYLFHGSLNRFLALSTDTPVVRYLDLPEPVRPLKVVPPLRVLVAIAGPKDLVELDVEQEWERLHAAVAELEHAGAIAVERLDHAGLGPLQHALRRSEYHVFHFVGHGAFDERLQDGVLMMEDAQGRGVVVGAQRLGTLLHDHRSLRLALLNACEGARTDSADPFAGVAQTLVQQGLAAVIAMQFEISDMAAITLANEFYGALADGYPIEAALAEARKAIFNAGNDTEWATPVLHLRASDSHLFDLHRVSHDGPDVVHTVVEPTRPEALPLPAGGEAIRPEVVSTGPPAQEREPRVPALRPVVTALVAAVVLAVAYALPLYTTSAGTDVSWHSFTPIQAPDGSVFASLEVLTLLAGTGVAAVLALRPWRSALAGGLLTGFGAAGVIKAVSTLWWIDVSKHSSAGSGVFLLFLGAMLAVVAGLDLSAHTKERGDQPARMSLTLVALGAVLTTAAIRIPSRRTPSGNAGFVYHKWHELAYEPIAIALAAIGIVILARRAGEPLFAGGVLIALGLAALSYWIWFAGVPTFQWVRGAGVRPLPGGFVGAAGALILVAAGRRCASPSWQPVHRAHAP
jgi:CHAT domain